MQDINGREYAKLSLLSRGDLVETEGFTCIEPDTRKIVLSNNGEYYLQCSLGRHYLEGQIMEDGDSLVGVYKIEVSRD